MRMYKFVCRCLAVLYVCIDNQLFLCNPVIKENEIKQICLSNVFMRKMEARTEI